MEENRKKKTALWIAIAAILLLLIGVVVYMIWEKPPEVTEVVSEPTEIVPEEEPTPTPEPTPEPMPEGTAFENSRQDGVYTFLLVGLDQMSGSTDTILVGRFDTVKHEVNLVSIPRDTIINVDAEVRKLNSVYVGSLNWGGNGIDSLYTQIRWLTGFEPDCYAILDLHTFIEIIDELGGVDFDVPEEMEYMYDDIEKRLAAHNSGHGAKYTRSRRPVTLVHLETFDTKEAAMSREWHLKRMSREEKLRLIRGAQAAGNELQQDGRHGP